MDLQALELQIRISSIESDEMMEQSEILDELGTQ